MESERQNLAGDFERIIFSECYSGNKYNVFVHETWAMAHGHIYNAYQHKAWAMQFSKHSKSTNDENSSHPKFELRNCIAKEMANILGISLKMICFGKINESYVRWIKSGSDSAGMAHCLLFLLLL